MKENYLSSFPLIRPDVNIVLSSWRIIVSIWDSLKVGRTIVCTELTWNDQTLNGTAASVKG